MTTRASGFTALEVILAVAVLGIVLAILIPAFIGNLGVNTSSEERQQAVTVVRSELERLRRIDPGNLPSVGQEVRPDVSLGARSYRVTVSFCQIATLCSANARHIEVEAHLNGRQIYTIETVYTQLETSGQ